MMVYDDSAFNDGFTLTDSYSIYPNAFNSYSNDGRYTKHIYLGSERIASQLSTSFPAQGNVAGYNVGIRVDYANKRDLMNAQIDSAYTAFGLVYKGINSDVDNYYPFDDPNYWNNAHHAPSVENEQVEQAPFNSQRDMVYYYHKDHLGSSAFITNDSACVTQQIESLPYGEVFLEKQRYTSDFQTIYRFNGKELDEETGLYYYGARYMNPRLSIWYGCDPLQEKYPHVSSYTYCLNNPTNHIDLLGDSTFLYATTLPGAPDVLSWATHTFISVEKENGQKIIFSYGPKEDGVTSSLFGDKLVQKKYLQDKQVVEGNVPEVVKKRISITPPDNMSISEFDEAVIRSGNSFGSVDGISYTLNANGSTTGNCNSSSSTLLYKAGLTMSDILLIEKEIPGIKWGFGNIKPWTKSEQIKAVQQAKEAREFRLRNSLYNIHLRR